jgi:hydroxymethylglutaryl-CoA lyase
VGFDSIDFGSFVSPKAIPQMVDTAAVLDQWIYHKLQVSFWRLLIAREFGAIRYCSHFRFLRNFQMRNTHKTIAESLVTLTEILEIADQTNK